MNHSFLGAVAEDLVSRFGTDLARVTVVFPNVRAGLFFNNELYRCVGKPFFAPRYASIDSLFEQASRLHKADAIQLIGELYQTYIEVYNRQASAASKETLDEFFFFGEVLLNDFDEVDKSLVNAKTLFSNLQDLDRLRDDFSHLSEKQIQTISENFSKAFVGDSPLKEAFWRNWNILGEVYTEFRNRLTNMGLAYPGMLTRDVVDRFDEELFPEQTYVFAGFNVLNHCEQALFKYLKGKSLFYWDCDCDFLNTNAGRFIKENVSKYGSSLDLSQASYTSENKKIEIISSASESGQASIIPHWTSEINKEELEKPESAIVLCNEIILPSVMHSIPLDEVEHVNITMGFPLSQTSVHSFLYLLMDMQSNAYVSSAKAFRYQYVLPVLRHAYTRMIFPQAKEVEKEITQNNLFYPAMDTLQSELFFTYADTTEDLLHYLLRIVQQLGVALGEEKNLIYNDLDNESVFRAWQVLNRLSGLINQEAWKMEKPTLERLLKKLLSTVRIPFHGEPVKGLQVMGILETRALDFKNILMLSTNEGYMPGTNNDNSFIPEFLRKHFGLSTIEHQDAIFAYYFYRLLQRAEKITYVYNTGKESLGKPEMSRFLLQLLVDTNYQGQIKRSTLHSSITPWQSQSISITKDSNLESKIRNLFDWNINPEARRLSPSAMNTYIDCPFKFYQQYIEGLKVPDELSDELDNSVVGSIFHRAAEYLYREIGHIPEDVKKIPPFGAEENHLLPYLSAPHKVEKLVTRAFAKEYFKGKMIEPTDFDGQQLIKYKIICFLMERLIKFDAARAPFQLVGLEYSITTPLQLNTSNALVKFGGIIDRLKEDAESCYVEDYKSSGSSKNYKELADLFTQKDGRASHIFQTFIYSLALIKENKIKEPIVPCLLYMQEIEKEDYSPVVKYHNEPITDFRELQTEFESLLIEKLDELFDVSIPFSQTDVLSSCKYCDFKAMCNR